MTDDGTRFTSVKSNRFRKNMKEKKAEYGRKVLFKPSQYQF